VLIRLGELDGGRKNAPLSFQNGDEVALCMKNSANSLCKGGR